MPHLTSRKQRKVRSFPVKHNIPIECRFFKKSVFRCIMGTPEFSDRREHWKCMSYSAYLFRLLRKSQ